MANTLSKTFPRIFAILLFAAGVSWLVIVTHSWRQAAFFGLYPFLFAEVSKVMLAAGGAVRLRRSL